MLKKGVYVVLFSALLSVSFILAGMLGGIFEIFGAFFVGDFDRGAMYIGWIAIFAVLAYVLIKVLKKFD